MRNLNRDFRIKGIGSRRVRVSGAGPVAPWSVGLLVAALMTACAPARIPAPVENRSVGKSAAVQRSASNSTSKSTSSFESSSSLGVPEGFYRVKRGDTLISISLDHGIAWRDLALWNSIDNPNLIEVDQLLRVSFPNAPKTEVKSIGPVAGRDALAKSAPGQTTPTPPSSEISSQSANSASAAKAASENMVFAWPGKGQVITQFADPGYKGIAIAGNEGDPVSAAADGRIVYSGNGLRGYGNLVIIKHDGDFLTAYAHNKSILVNEGQMVKRGQKIAELGKTDSDIPKLHFEVRKSGKPVDPLKFLASR